MRLRFFLAFALIIFVTLAVVAAFMLQSNQQEVRSFMGRGGWLGAEEIIITLESHYQIKNSWEGVGVVMAQLVESQGRGQGGGSGRSENSLAAIISDLRLADGEGYLVYDPNNPITQEKLTNAALKTGLILTANDSTIGYLLPPENTTFPGSNYETALLENLNKALVNSALISGLLALVMAVALAYILIKPIAMLTNAAGRLAAGDLSQRVNINSPRELASLGNTFNLMAGSLEQAESNRQAMTADIAHELRNPLAVQRANLEALQDGIYPLSQETIKPILEQNQLLTRLVEDLRTIALADAGQLSLHLQEVDLANLVRETSDRFKVSAAQKNINLALALSSDCRNVTADPERIQQILHNLLQNALRHTPESGSISLSLAEIDEHTCLEIRDSGPGIPPDRLDTVFQRFLRIDSARSRDDGGTGLGLSIARQLAEAHGGSLSASNHPRGGAVFTLTLPAATSSQPES
jgi:two-component system, OmpR family, sensor histidine kinase BaeS